jgi:quercetin dioxygenase-like cupin family protein
MTDVTPPALPDDDLTRQLTITDADAPGVPHIALAGGTYSILISGDQTEGAYTLIDMIIPPGGGPGPHRHDFEELFIVMEGTIDYTLRGHTTTAVSVQAVNIPANAPHFFKNSSETTAHLLCVCTPAAQDKFFLEVGDMVPNRESVAPVDGPEAMAVRLKRIIALAPLYRTEMLPPVSAGSDT